MNLDGRCSDRQSIHAPIAKSRHLQFNQVTADGLGSFVFIEKGAGNPRCPRPVLEVIHQVSVIRENLRTRRPRISPCGRIEPGMLFLLDFLHVL